MKYKGKGEHSVNQLESIIEELLNEKSAINKVKIKAIEALQDFVENESEISRHLDYANELAEDYRYLFDNAKTIINASN